MNEKVIHWERINTVVFCSEGKYTLLKVMTLGLTSLG